MGLVDQVKNKLNIGNKDDAPTNQGAPTSNTHHHTTTRKTLSFLLLLLLHPLLLCPDWKYKASFPQCASSGDSLGIETHRAGNACL